MEERADCPKRMVYGPCGGVRADGGCEMAPHPCVFPDAPVPPAAHPRPPAVELPRPFLLADWGVPGGSADDQRAAAAALGEVADAVLAGDHQDRPEFPPTQLARLAREAGVTPWVTLACRDRNRFVLRQELHGLAREEVGAVLCVTGDGRAYDVSPDVTQVFDLDSVRLTALAAEVGVPAAVAESPVSPPVQVRPGRLVGKQRAGAGVAVLNHAGTPAAVAGFVDAARSRGLTVPVLAAVAVFTDSRSAAVLAALPGLELDPAQIEAVMRAPDPVEAGITAAVAEATALLAIEGVAGLNLSGLGAGTDWRAGVEVMVETGRRIRQAVAAA
ncbi:methylenetetrahydrofolate reductase C-terminal domain-containing protein [Jatrophihabitans sp. YIM 134969]